MRTPLIAPWKNASFHGEKLEGALTLLVYDANTRLLVSRLPAKIWFDCALSPNGTQIAIGGAKGIKIYLVN
jgi:hypothetical protein